MTFCRSGASKMFAQRSVAQSHALPLPVALVAISRARHRLMQDIAPTPANSSFLKSNSTEPSWKDDAPTRELVIF
jgi:hypothetical protein